MPRYLIDPVHCTRRAQFVIRSWYVDDSLDLSGFHAAERGSNALVPITSDLTPVQHAAGGTYGMYL